MSAYLVRILTSTDPDLRDRSIDAFCRAASLAELLAESAALERYRRGEENLYQRVRACFFLYAIYRFYLPEKQGLADRGGSPYAGYLNLLHRRFDEAVGLLRRAEEQEGPNRALASALALAYQQLGFQTLADQVRRSVRTLPGNQWMFRVGHPADQPLRVRPELAQRDGDGAFPLLVERTPVRMDLTHSAWSDIFFLGMDCPQGARVLNISIDLAVHGRDAAPRPPVEAYFRVIDEPVIRLSSVDLGASAEITALEDVFDFAKDYLGLLKAALIASGLVPPGIEGSAQRLSDLLARLVGPGRGIELVSSVNNIPKGSRLAVSTNLLAALIAACMRATGQVRKLEGSLEESERRLIAGRAILGEWLAGSGGGWQDSGGVWPGVKLIEGEEATPGSPEWGVSRGKLLPTHRILGPDEISAATREKLQESLVLVHGGLAQNVGPILEMVTEKYLLRSEAEWRARGETQRILTAMLEHLSRGDIRALGEETTRNFNGPLQTIIPWASNLYTETLIAETREAFGEQFWGFWMLGGMSGGGMGFIFDPRAKAAAQEQLLQSMSAARQRLEHALPFAMDPVVYDFAINERGTWATLRTGTDALMPAGYYAATLPALVRQDRRALSASRRAELDAFGMACRTRPELSGMVQVLFDALLPRTEGASRATADIARLLQGHGFDPVQHERVREDLRSGRVGMAHNRLPVSTVVSDCAPEDVRDARALTAAERRLGQDALESGAVAVVTFAGGAGTRWTQGAGVVKALHPYARLGGRHRTFLETHLAKTRLTALESRGVVPHVFTTSYLTHAPIQQFLEAEDYYGCRERVYLSPSKSIGLRLTPMVRDLSFAWEETPQAVLDEQAQKVRESQHAALKAWAERQGEGSDYLDNVPTQCVHPLGHWYELPNMLKNGVLARLLDERPNVRHLMLHNIDTVGANVDPAILGWHIAQGKTLSFEVIPREVWDSGGGLARVDGRLRLMEGIAAPREEDAFALSYYNSATCWVALDPLLALFGLTRETLRDEAAVNAGIRSVAARMPTYVTLKDVKRRWGHGQEDVFPITQWEKLWGDMTTLSECPCAYVAVGRERGQQLKEQAQLDGWMRDGTAAYVESLCGWR